MSEKFNTDELVTELRDIVNCANQLEGKERFVLANEESFHAIIARLRAADKLCEEAQRKINIQAMDGGLWFVAITASEEYLQNALRELHFVIEKAIANYEGVK